MPTTNSISLFGSARASPYTKDAYDLEAGLAGVSIPPAGTPSSIPRWASGHTQHAPDRSSFEDLGAPLTDRHASCIGSSQQRGQSEAPPQPLTFLPPPPSSFICTCKTCSQARSSTVDPSFQASLPVSDYHPDLQYYARVSHGMPLPQEHCTENLYGQSGENPHNGGRDTSVASTMSTPDALFGSFKFRKQTNRTGPAYTPDMGHVWNPQWNGNNNGPVDQDYLTGVPPSAIMQGWTGESAVNGQFHGFSPYMHANGYAAFDAQQGSQGVQRPVMEISSQPSVIKPAFCKRNGKTVADTLTDMIEDGYDWERASRSPSPAPVEGS